VDGSGPGLGGFVGRDPGGEGVGLVEKGADGGLVAPDDELLEGELVLPGDVREGAGGLEEIAQEVVGVDGLAVDLVLDGGLERGMK
jgi:hypothetical protein